MVVWPSEGERSRPRVAGDCSDCCHQKEKMTYSILISSLSLHFICSRALSVTSCRHAFLRRALGNLCEDHGYTYHWTSSQKPHLTKKGKRIDCVVPGLSTSSSTTPTRTSSASSSQDSVFDVRRYAENPVPEEEGVRVTKSRMKDAKEYKAIHCMTCPTCCRSSEKIWSMKVVFQSHGEPLHLRIKTLPVLIMNCQWSREQKWYRASTAFLLTFRRTQIVISA